MLVMCNPQLCGKCAVINSSLIRNIKKDISHKTLGEGSVPLNKSSHGRAKWNAHGVVPLLFMTRGHCRLIPGLFPLVYGLY